MKTLEIKIIAIVGNLLLFFSAATFSQTQYLGNWEGFFMNDFKTIVELKQDKNNNYLGKIKMFQGSNLIQDDEITKINISKNLLTFTIESKDTEFKGEFNNEFSALVGNFIFPDHSEHPLKLLKAKNPKSSEINSVEPYLDLKNRKYSIDELKDDYNFLIEKLEEYHPQLYAYITKEKYDRLVSSLQKDINSELTIVEFFNLIAPVVENIKCSHTGIRLPAKFQDGVNKYENFLPLKLLFEREKVYCRKNYNSTSEITPGSEILSINDIPVQTIKEKLFKFIPSEGNNTTTKNYYLNENFNSLFNLIDNSETFEIEYKKSNSRLTTTLNACKYSELQTENEANKKEVPLHFLWDDKNGTGFLTIKLFSFPDINKYIQEMDSIFLKLQNENAKKLVIDLRGNSGGHPIFAAQLLSYLTDKEFTYFERNNDVKDFEPLYNKMQPNKIQFKGNIYVFVDGGCLSTTGHLISLMNSNTNATFIGEEPGSTYKCNDFSLKVTLPNTGIEVNIPRTTFETANNESEKTVPFAVDYPINLSIKDYLDDEDSYIKCLNKLIY